MKTPTITRITGYAGAAGVPGRGGGLLLVAVLLLVSLVWIGSAKAAPPNDDRANAVQVSDVRRIDQAQSLVGSTLGATKEPGEPDHAGEPGGASVWYWYVGPPWGVPVTFETVGSSFDTVLAVYRSQPFGQLTELVAADDNSAGGGASRVSFVPAAQTGYLIAVDGVGGASGQLRLTRYLTPPANDDFADALQLSGPSGRVSGLNVGATTEAGEPLHDATPQNPSSSSVWWRWTAPQSGPVTFDVSQSQPMEGFGNSFTPNLAIYTGSSVGSLTRVEVTRPSGNAQSFVASAGTTYQIAAASMTPFGPGRVVLQWGGRPANDDLADAEAIAGASGSVTGRNTGATSEPGEPEHGPDASSRASIWYRWTAPATGSATLTTAGSSTGIVLAAYTGSGYAGPGLSLVARGSSVTFAAQAGTSYRIALDGIHPYRGGTQLSWTLIAVNAPPVVAAGGAAAIGEGASLTRSGSFSDPDSASWTATVDYGDGSGPQPLTLRPDRTFDLSRVYADDGSHTVTVVVTDDDGAAGTGTFTVAVANVAPAITSITAPGSPVRAGTGVAASAAFTDPGSSDTHSASWSWGDGTSSAGTVAGLTATGSHSYAAAGVYTVTLTVTDDDGGSGTSAYRSVVVYDPDAGSITGGGWIDSPAGAYAASPALKGRASFGFVSRYPKGSTAPQGETEFQLKAAGLTFHSTSYDYLVVSGALARYRGTGTINGRGSYELQLSALDGHVAGGGGVDRFRIRLVDRASGAVVYDSERGAAEDAAPTTALGGGSIAIHR